jgi:hypothetical protein
MSESNYDDSTFTIQQTADEELHCTRQHVGNLMRTGKLEYSKVGARVVIRGRAIRKLLDSTLVGASK